MHEEMVAQGDGEKQIYIGEYGFSHADTWMKAVPDATRADWLRRAYGIAGQTEYISGLSWFSLYEIPPWNIIEPSTNAESLTFGAFREITPG